MLADVNPREMSRLGRNRPKTLATAAASGKICEITRFAMLEITPRPGGYRLTSEVRLPAPRDEVFQFFADATQLERLTPPWLKFSVATRAPIQMREGTLIDYKLRVHGIPLRWQSRISCWEPPIRFADEQLRGPYREWNHTHTFVEDGTSTICRDEVDYDFVGGPLIHALFVKRDLETIFAFRTKVLKEIFR
jgi:ligand-binding SRPBCC domain-containing protein